MIKTILLSIVGALVLAVGVGSWWILTDVNQPSRNDAAVNITVAKGSGIRAVAQTLYNQRCIPSRQAWLLYAGITGRFRSVLPGTYSIPPRTTGRQILDTLALGPSDTSVRVTIPEGMRVSDIAVLLEKKGVVSSADFLALAQHPQQFVASWTTDLFASKPAAVDLEGYLFPDTYDFFKQSSAESVVTKMVGNTDQRLTPTIRQQIVASGHTLHEILTMASILELELKSASDRALAADLFWRRIAAGQPLQSDATVNYATGHPERATTTIDDTKVVSSYNTYLNKGLPIGPIDNPGLISIQAALQPTPNEYWYFLTTPTGQTVWAKTYAEHLANKHRYLP